MVRSITDAEWIVRYARRMMSQANIELSEATRLAKEGWKLITEDGSGYEEPETAADKELIYWSEE